ncbi:MAG: SWIM zinc finger family protein [Paracoccaceae bacterium]
MSAALDAIAALAPDRSSLKAAHAQMKPAKWPVRAVAPDPGLVWGECQGSGANPYRAVFDTADRGYKCTCPSRKFPCKHVLALMWMHAEDPASFVEAAVPDWVEEWRGRRRKPSGEAAPSAPGRGAESLAAARAGTAGAPPDPGAEARRRAAAEKRARETEAALLAATEDVERWIADQLRTGLAGLSGALAARCRAIAARLVDGKAQALAGRLDELPARVMALAPEARADALVVELGKIVLLARAFRADPADPERRRAVATAETRESLLGDARAPRARGTWEVVGERIATRRDGLVSQETWLLNLADGGPRFALLLDFFPASAGRRASAFASGERFEASLAFYPARAPLRAVVIERGGAAGAPLDWPAAGGDPLAGFLAAQDAAPWTTLAPVLLGPGGFGEGAGRWWWRSACGAHALPLASPPPEPARGMTLTAAAGLWEPPGRLPLLAARSDWGRLALDG